MNLQLKEADVLEYRPNPRKSNKVVIQHEENQEISIPLTSAESLQQRYIQIKKAGKKKMSVAEKIEYHKELYNITYQLNKEKKMYTIPMAVMIIAIILLTLLL